MLAKNRLSLLVGLILTLAVLAAGCAPQTGGATTPALTAALYEVSGTVQTLKPSEGLFKDAADGTTIEVSDQVLTYDNGRTRVDLSNGTIVRVGPLTTFTLEAVDVNASGPFARFKLDIGELWIILNGGQVNVDTPAGLASVRGSYLNVIVRPDTGETIVTCLEGTCTLGNDGGTVTLGAGETARILNTSLPPQTGKMDDQDVQRWLDANPEATLVVVPLSPVPDPVTPTPTATLDPSQPTSTLEPTLTPTAGASPTPSATAIDCGPPDGWVIYVVKAGETLFGLGGAFQVPVPDLQKANCMGDSVAILAGQGLFVPNRATVTPTITPTPVPTRTPTKTSIPANTNTPVTPAPTKSPTTSPTPVYTATKSGSGTNAVFTSPIGPDITSIGTCENFYSINVTDPDGILTVKLVASVNDPAFTNPTYHLMFDQGGGTYEINLAIDTSANVGSDTVYYRFEMVDLPGWTQRYPTTPRSFTDALDCGPATATPDPSTTFILINAPADSTTIISCTNQYTVEVMDVDGVTGVYIEYSVNDPSFSTPFPYVETFNYISGNVWEVYANLDSSTDGTPSVTDTVYWRIKAQDGLSNITYFPATYFQFDDPNDCSGV